jgi:hypothetical protein
MPTCKPYDHAIELLPGTSLPKLAKGYPCNHAEQVAIKLFIKEHLEKGYIRPSKSSTAAPCFFVKKLDGSLQLVQDYWKLNEVTKKNQYPLPCIADLINMLTQSFIFTKMNLLWGFNNICIKEGDEEKVAFVADSRLWEPTVMFFGFCNAPSTFQNMMNNVLAEEIATGNIVVYIDDILVYNNDITTHQRLVNSILKKLQENNLFCKPEKCKFKQEKVNFLGLIIGHNSMEMDPKKVEGVTQWPAPKSVKHIQVFLGLANFYQRFIKDFTKIVQPLTLLTCKGTPWQWTEKEQTAFDTLKTMFTTAPLLQIPNNHSPYRLETDALDFATGAVLEQLREDGKWQPVAFSSKSLNAHKRNYYEIYDKELLAIIRALEEY